MAVHNQCSIKFILTVTTVISGTSHAVVTKDHKQTIIRHRLDHRPAEHKRSNLTKLTELQYIVIESLVEEQHENMDSLNNVHC